MENENATKSIIYGNVFENRYGRFMPICSSILDRSSINTILEYLKETPHFKKFNRVAYAYRVDEMPVVFITEKKNVETQFYQGFHSDETIEGSGEKLLHLLQKFNIKNVLIAVLVEQFNPLMPFECTNYRAIVQNSRLLLDQLYRKVIQYQQQNADKNNNDLLLNQERVYKMNKVELGEQLKIPAVKKIVPKQRPNYVYGPKNQSSKPPFTNNKLKKPNELNQQELQFLWQRCRAMKEQYRKIADTLQDRQLQQMRYFVMYDKNQQVNIVVKMFMIYQGITKEQIIDEFDFKAYKKKELEMIPYDKLKKLDDILKTNKKLNLDVILGINRALGMVFSLMQISIKYSKNLERISTIIEKVDKKLSISTEKNTPVKIDNIL